MLSITRPQGVQLHGPSKRQENSSQRQSTRGIYPTENIALHDSTLQGKRRDNLCGLEWPETGVNILNQLAL